jgi:hypothetical protein
VKAIAYDDLRMDPALINGWGTKEFDIDRFLEEFIRKYSANGVSQNEDIAYNKFKEVLTPKLLAYSPRENMWIGVLEAYKSVSRGYGETVFQDCIAEKINTWANVKGFWKGLLADKRCSVALNALVTSILADWEGELVNNKFWQTPTLWQSLSIASRLAANIRETGELMERYGYSYSHSYMHPRLPSDPNPIKSSQESIPNSRVEVEGAKSIPKATRLG